MPKRKITVSEKKNSNSKKLFGKGYRYLNSAQKNYIDNIKRINERYKELNPDKFDGINSKQINKDVYDAYYKRVQLSQATTKGKTTMKKAVERVNRSNFFMSENERSRANLLESLKDDWGDVYQEIMLTVTKHRNQRYKDMSGRFSKFENSADVQTNMFYDKGLRAWIVKDAHDGSFYKIDTKNSPKEVYLKRLEKYVRTLNQ